MKRRIALFLIVGWLGCFLPGAAFAATITVDTANDEFDSDGDCSLREAVYAASNDVPWGACSAGSGADVVTFASGLIGRTITLLIEGGDGPSGDIDIYGDSLTIRGPVEGDAGSIVIDGNGATRVFDVSAETQIAFLHLYNLTIQNGRVEAADARGGGIRVRSDDTRLSLDHVRVVDNAAVAVAGNASGGGVYTRGSFSLSHTVISGNTASAKSAEGTMASGGGLYAAYGNMSTDNAARKVEISANSAISDNGPAFGGGVYLAASLNEPPVVSAPVSDQNFRDPVADSASFDLTTVFSDPDGDVLSFQAQSVDTGVAAVTVSDVMLEVVPTGPGRTVVTVTADDQRGGTATTQFDVEVGQPNQAPIVTNGIPAQTFTVGDPAATINLPSIFSDPDGDPLTFGADSTNVTVTAPSVTGNVLTITPVGSGSATVSVTANDGRGGTATTGTQVTVTQPNLPPVVANPIQDQTRGAFSSFTVDLGPVFSDPDGDVLTYAATSMGDPGISATVSGDQLQVMMSTSGDGVGSATITVTADDNNGGTVADPFEAVFVSGPLLIAKPAGVAPPATGAGGDFVAYNIANATVQVRFVNTTISGNSAESDGGRLSAGGGLYVGGVKLGVGLKNVTIAQNTVQSPAGTGGGFAVAGAEIRLANTIVAGNAAQQGPDCAALTPGDLGVLGVVTSAGYNLVGNGSGCPIGTVNGDQVGTGSAPIDPQLGALANNGGGTRTHALLFGSPATDAGNPDPPGSDPASCAATDQRGEPRPRDGDGDEIPTCDVGAYEAATNEPPTLIKSIPDQALTAGAEDLTIDLSTIFVDPEGGLLRFSASSSNPAVATASVSGTILRVVAVSPGSAVITVIAEDNLGALRSFRLAVSKPNSGSGDGAVSAGGGGCTLAAGPTAVDPMLWLLVLLAFGWRYRGYLRR